MASSFLTPPEVTNTETLPTRKDIPNTVSQYRPPFLDVSRLGIQRPSTVIPDGTVSQYRPPFLSPPTTHWQTE